MQNDFLDEFWRGLKFQLPYVLAYSIGIVVAFNHWRRYPVPSSYTFLACSIKLGVAIIYPLTEAYLLLQGRLELFEVVTLAIGVVDASAYGLLFLAVFSARGVMPRSYFWPDDIEPDDAAPPGDDAGYHEPTPR